MEKISLKPVSKELLYRNEEPNVHFDVLAYEGANNQEKSLGSVYLIGHAKYEEEDLGYVISLISSIARREYYSDEAIRAQDGRRSFEHTLKKLNEVLEDFFKNKTLDLNIGLVAIAGDNIYISKLGKFKVALAREGQYVDVLNNVNFFTRSSENETQFSNIISGKIQPGDKVFAYYPSRPISLREKSLNNVFVAEPQNGFTEKIAQLASTVDKFACCGVHITIEQIKEIPVSTNLYNRATLTSASESNPAIKIRPTIDNGPAVAPNISVAGGHTQEHPAPADTVLAENVTKIPPAVAPVTVRPMPPVKVMSAEVSFGKRQSVFSKVASSAGVLKRLQALNTKQRITVLGILAAIIIVPLAIFRLVHQDPSSKAAKVAVTSAAADYDSALAKIGQNDFRDARILLQNTIQSLSGTKDSHLADIVTKAAAALDSLNKKQPSSPSLWFDPTGVSSAATISMLVGNGNLVYGVNSAGDIYNITKSGQNKITSAAAGAYRFMSDGKFISVSDGQKKLFVYDLTKKKAVNLNFKTGPTVAEFLQDQVVFGDNLYALDGNDIFKYANVTSGKDSRSQWNKSSLEGSPIAISADGNLNILTSDGHIIIAYKGQVKNTIDLELTPASSSRLFTNKNSNNFYVTSTNKATLFIFDKTTGSVTASYDFSSLGAVSDINIDASGTAWILTKNGKVYSQGL